MPAGSFVDRAVLPAGHALADAEHYRESVGVWSAYAGSLVYALTSAGIPVPPMPPLPKREDDHE